MAINLDGFGLTAVMQIRMKMVTRLNSFNLTGHFGCGLHHGKPGVFFVAFTLNSMQHKAVREKIKLAGLIG